MTVPSDVLVIGGGSSGAVVAGRLAVESDARVVLAEAGPDYAAVALGIPRADDLDDLDGDIGFGVEPVNIDMGSGSTRRSPISIRRAPDPT